MNATIWLAAVTLASGLLTAPTITHAVQSEQPAFATPQAAVKALIDAVNGGKLDDILALFGPESRELVDADPATGRRNREVFAVAASERWRLDDDGADRKVLVIGREEWPFPVPLTRDARGWRFNSAAGKEEIVDRRIGRNELSVIQTCHAYVAAQHAYARDGHDGQPAGRFARRLQSDPGTQNGLYWPVAKGQPRSPLGALVAQAAEEGRAVGTGAARVPFHGYYFRILTAQGAKAPGGAKSFEAGGQLSGGFALIARPASYDASGVMTFIVNQDGAIYEKDLGPATATVADSIDKFDPDTTWKRVR